MPQPPISPESRHRVDQVQTAITIAIREVAAGGGLTDEEITAALRAELEVRVAGDRRAATAGKQYRQPTRDDVNAMAADADFTRERHDEDIDIDALRVARRVVEDVLVDLRDNRVSVMSAGNGFAIRDMDSPGPSLIRLSTIEGLEIGIRAYLAAEKHEPERWVEAE